MNYKKYIKKSFKFLLLFMIVGGSSCQYFSPKEGELGTEVDPLLARVGEQALYLSELSEFTGDKDYGKDSAAHYQRLVHSWVKQQLLISKAKEEGIDLAEINQRVDAYLNSLLVYEFKKRYISRNMEASVKDEEILTYYETNKKNFELKQNIVKGFFVQLPANSPRLKDFRKWFRSSKENDLDKMKAYCFQYAQNYHIDETIWMPFDGIVKNTPFGSLESKGNFLKKNNFAERTENEMIYFLKIKEYKLIGSTPPLDFIKDQVTDIVLNKRKVEMLKNLEKDIYNRAERNHEIEIIAQPNR
ncbi:hypothetical protein [Persicobacter sp. CCB-QB2]|uniref:hypothetical protein n=1 Tax=Persicobacter sp. CCB-QB2 TaxID=1561025 RepID=UPI0012F9B8DD|nr:hypothetical protein [Persicobacter sp. CCB-QB2]